MTTRFVLLTAAKNEARYIGTAIESVLRQSVLPAAWFIMDDGSSDDTPEIVASYAERHPFIRLQSNRTGGARSFGAQYRAINRAYELASGLQFDYVAMQDADIAPVRSDYFEQVLQRLDQEPRLGITGGYIHEPARGEWRCRGANSPDAVAGGVQVWRRECYEQVGGYTPLMFGGEDWLAQLDAKQAGWNVRAQTDLAVHHHRPTSSADGRIRGLFRLGMMDASFGSHPLFELLKCARRVSERPALLGCAVRYAGYAWGSARMPSPLLAPATVAYLRQEQLRKIQRLWPFAATGTQGDPA